MTKEQRKWMNEGTHRATSDIVAHFNRLVARINSLDPHGPFIKFALREQEWLKKRADRTAARVGGLGRR